MYGHQWASVQGDEPTDTWIRGLADLTTTQYGAGLRACINRASTWPPNLVEFRQLCIGYDPLDWQRGAEKTVQTSTLLENKTAKEERCDAGLVKIREIIKEAGF